MLILIPPCSRKWRYYLAFSWTDKCNVRNIKCDKTLFSSSKCPVLSNRCLIFSLCLCMNTFVYNSNKEIVSLFNSLMNPIHLMEQKAFTECTPSTQSIKSKISCFINWVLSSVLPQYSREHSHYTQARWTSGEWLLI